MTDAGSAAHDDDGYRGPAELIVGGTDGSQGDGEVVAVDVVLAGHFDPISGHYSWYGRVAAAPAVTALVERGVRAVTLRTPFASVQTKLSDVDPWGRPRVEGFGETPFEVLDTVPADPR